MDDGSVPSGTKTAIADGTIYFFAVNGNCVFSYTLTSGDITNLGTATPAPIVINQVPASANTAMLLTNYAKAGYTYPASTGQTVTTIKGLQITVDKQQPSTAATSVANVIMSGVANIVTHTGASPLYTVDLAITPIMSRLEISRVGVRGNGTQKGDITEFRLRGIFISNHYLTSTVYGNSTVTLINKGGDESFYTGSFPFATGTGYLNDYALSSVTFPGLAHTVTTNMWSYHVFPVTTAGTLPHIVVAVDHIKYIDENGTEQSWKNGNMKYITVTTYVDQTSSTPLTEMKPSFVYKIVGTDGPNGPGKPGGSGGIIFGLDNLGEKPYTLDQSVSCNITVTPWNVTNIIPNPL
ncbi:MAG: hypothetical protein ACRCX4_13285 [Bacteroidales bacterium]